MHGVFAIVYLISSSFGASRTLCFLIVTFPGYCLLYLLVGCDSGHIYIRAFCS